MSNWRMILGIALLPALAASGQGMYGADLGVGVPTAYRNRNTIYAQGYYLHRINHRVYAGATMMYQRYSLVNELNPATATYGDVLSIQQRSNFLYFSPKVDVGIGYRKYFHVFASAGIGFNMGSTQTSYTHVPYWTPPGGAPYGNDTAAVNTSYNVPSVVSRVGVGLTQRIPTHRFFNLVLTQEYSLIGGNISNSAPAMKIGYLSFGIGIMHKYPMVRTDY